MNKKVVLYIATSLDDKIARLDGELDWLEGHDNPENEDYGYPTFLESIDTVVMGRKTYDEILGFGIEWPYKDCTSYVVSGNKKLQISTPNTHLLGTDFYDKIESLKKESGKNIWLLGGAGLVISFLNQDLLDEMIITKIPVLIGEGVPLFDGLTKDVHFELQKVDTYQSGVVNLFYSKK